MCRTPVARVTTAATMGATYPQGLQASLTLEMYQFLVLATHDASTERG